VRALEVWLERSGITSGYLFPAIGRWGGEVSEKPICDHQLAKIIKRLAGRAGLGYRYPVKRTAFLVAPASLMRERVWLPSTKVFVSWRLST
jgi:hypothetical protein